jgi:hypothetical protein
MDELEEQDVENENNEKEETKLTSNLYRVVDE